MSPLPLYPDLTAPGGASSSEPLTPGGTLELREKTLSGNFELIAFVNNIVSGLVLTDSLSSLSKLQFEIPRKKFSPSQGKNLDSIWSSLNTGDDPWDKPARVKDNLYLWYVQEDRTRPFRILTLDFDDYENLTGQALDASIQLSDYLTQYAPGRPLFAGAMPSEVADRLLQGHQPLVPANRRFVRDIESSFNTSIEVPDQRPIDYVTGASPLTPLPFMTDIPALSVAQLATISGNPTDTVPPAGSDAFADTFDTVNGSHLYFAFDDVPSAAERGVPATADKKYGWFTYPYKSSVLTGAINYGVSSAAQMSITLDANIAYTSRAICTAVKASATGTFKFRVISAPGSIVRFGGNIIARELTKSSTDVTWSVDLQQDRYYMIIILHSRGVAASASLQLFWTVPGGSEVLVPASNLSWQPFQGMTTVRVTDITGRTCYLQCYKHWSGKALTIGYPMAIGTIPFWPATIPAGSLVEEVTHPSKSALAKTLNWGTGWTRNAEIVPSLTAQAQRIHEFSEPATTMQPRSEGY